MKSNKVYYPPFSEGRSLWSVWISFQSLICLLEHIQHTVYPALSLPFRCNISLDLVMSCILYSIISLYLFTTTEWMNSKHAWPHASPDSWSEVSEALKVRSKPFFFLSFTSVYPTTLIWRPFAFCGGSRILTLDLFVNDCALLHIPAGITRAVASPQCP